MWVLYNSLVHIGVFCLRFGALINKKIAHAYEGRKKQRPSLIHFAQHVKQPIWIHCASAGEFEQVRALANRLCAQAPVLLTFFSASGYEKLSTEPQWKSCVFYLPFDTAGRVRWFIELVRPQIGIFVKYELWPNVLRAAKRQNVRLYLLSVVLRDKHKRWYNVFARMALRQFDTVLVQEEYSARVLAQMNGRQKCLVLGDTRVDSVRERVQQRAAKPIDWVETFKADKHLLILGSTWPADENMLKAAPEVYTHVSVKTLIVPHEIHPRHIERLCARFQAKAFSQMTYEQLAQSHIVILNQIGRLADLYQYADSVYVGGGWRTGLHNILEPAAWGKCIFIGAKHAFHFKEVRELHAGEALVVLRRPSDFTSVFLSFLDNDPLRLAYGQRARRYIDAQAGATDRAFQVIRANLRLTSCKNLLVKTDCISHP